jgi:tryptophan synthase alpha chain
MKGFYIVGGYPNRELFRKCLFEIAGKGFEFVEIGIPFSEPVADGPVIAEAIHEAVTNGVDISEIMEDVREMKEKFPEIKAVLMTYANIFSGYGEKKFSEDFGSFIDGVIIPDLPLRMQSWIKDRGLTIPVIPFVTPISRTADIEGIKGTDAPFVYYISVMGVTGMGAKSGSNSDNAVLAGDVSGKTVVTGFGIRTVEDASKALDATGGFVIGTEVVKRQKDFESFKVYISQFTKI